MNTFFRICVFLCFGMIIFTIGISFVQGLGIFPYQDPIGQQGITEENVLTLLTGLDGGMEGVWALLTLGTGLAAITLSILTNSLLPVGIYLFGTVFWTAYTKTIGIFSSGPFSSLPEGFLILFTVGMIFIFLAAIIGILTGSG